MKLQVYLTLTIIFLIFSAMKCDRNILESNSHLTDIKVENLEKKGEELVIAQSPTNRSSYTLGIKYIGKLKEEQSYMYYLQDSIVDQKIYCNTQFDSQHPPGTDVTNYFALYPNNDYNGAKLQLKRKPIPGKHSFKVCILKKDGSAIEKNTPLIELY